MELILYALAAVTVWRFGRRIGRAVERWWTEPDRLARRAFDVEIRRARAGWSQEHRHEFDDGR